MLCNAVVLTKLLYGCETQIKMSSSVSLTASTYNVCAENVVSNRKCKKLMFDKTVRTEEICEKLIPTKRIGLG